MNNSTHKDRTILLIGLVILCLWVRLPSIYQGMPYFSHEDEAHHFNRTVQMVQKGDWNPHYFHKPSLHFYLRAPIVAASFLLEVRRGTIRKIEEIQTRDRFGLAGYNFTASHPGIVKANRAFSIFLSLCVLILAFCITQKLSSSLFISSISALLIAFSPSLLEHSATIGVDVPMSFFCLLSTFLALEFTRHKTLKTIMLSALCAGLAISTKYNALPIVITPFIAALLSSNEAHRKIGLLLGTLLSISLGFILGSPYILSSFPLFLNQFAYEIWHYGIAGHQGNSAEPGIAQAIFYTRWLFQDGLGFFATILIPFGLFSAIVLKRKEALVLASFPIAFILLMILQKANFTRNMIVVIPYLAIFCAITFSPLFKLLTKKKGTAILFIPGIFALVILIIPAQKTLHARNILQKVSDTRTQTIDWLNENPISEETAIAGELQLPLSFSEKGLNSRQALSGETGLRLLLKGFERVVAGNLREPLTSVSDHYLLEKNFTGNSDRQRVVQSPEVIILKAKTSPYKLPQLDNTPSTHFTDAKGSPCITNKDSIKEGHCWLNWHQSSLKVNSSGTSPKFFAFTAMSPWTSQKIAFMINDKKEEFELQPGEWQRIVLNISEKEASIQGLVIHTYVKEIHSPSDLSASRDTRRLGVAFKDVAVQ